MADVNRLVRIGIVPQQAQELADQIDGSVAAKTQIAALSAIDTPDGSDAGTTQTLANACKAKINDIIAALKA